MPVAYPKYYNLGTYQTSGRLWKAIRISPFLTEEEIISLAKAIHSTDPTGEYKIFDDDDRTEYEKYKYWEENYPEGEYDTWASERYVGSIQKFPHPQTNKLVWTLVSGGNILKKDYILE